MAEPFARHALMGDFVVHAADQHGLAEIVHGDRDAQQPAHLRKAAVGGDQQRGGKTTTIRQMYAISFTLSLDRLDLGIGMNTHGAHIAHSLPGSSADHMIGHEIAKAILAEDVGINVEAFESAVAHMRAAQRVYFRRRDSFPYVQPLENIQ